MALASLFVLLPGLVSASLLHQRVPSSGCGSSAPIPLNERHNATVSSSNRTYMYWLPPTYNPKKPTPLILSFHGASRTADWQANLDLLTDPTFNTDHILVYPQGEWYGPEADDIFWQGSPGATADDVGYTLEILDELEDKLCVDPSRIYASGKSQGGGFSGVLACDPKASRRIAAFAAVSGAFYTQNADCSDPGSIEIPCNPGRCQIPIIDFHGGNDSTISINGGVRKGGCLPTIQHWVDEWVVRDGLDSASLKVSNLTSRATVQAYGTGIDKGLVTFVYDGAHVDHDWPATINNTDNIAHGSGPASFNASKVIMEFFAKYTLPKAEKFCNKTMPSKTSSLAHPSISCTSSLNSAATSISTKPHSGTTTSPTGTSTSAVVVTSITTTSTVTRSTTTSASGTPPAQTAGGRMIMPASGMCTLIGVMTAFLVGGFASL